MDDNDHISSVNVLEGREKCECALKNISQMKQLFDQHKSASLKAGVAPDSSVLVYTRYLEKSEHYIIATEEARKHGTTPPESPVVPTSLSYLKVIK